MLSAIIIVLAVAVVFFTVYENYLPFQEWVNRTYDRVKNYVKSIFNP